MATSRRTMPLRAEVDAELEAWRCRQQQRTPDRPAQRQSRLPPGTHTSGVDHGSLETLRAAIATQLAEAGLPPSKTQTFVGHAHVILLLARTGLRMDLLHTHATLLLRAGVNPRVVSERLGHSSVAFTLDTYAHVLPGMQAAAADAFAQLLREPDDAQ
jgi:integrase